jgi:hypothetical protein
LQEKAAKKVASDGTQATPGKAKKWHGLGHCHHQFLNEYMVLVQSLSHTWRYKQHSNHDLGFGESI